MIMKKKLANILSEIDLEIDEIDLYGYGTSFTGYFIRFTKRFANLCIPVKRGRNIFLQKPKTGIVRAVVVFS